MSGTSGTSGTSGFSIDSGSFATTGSNQFDGNQIITGSLSVSSFIDTSDITNLDGNISIYSQPGNTIDIYTSDAGGEIYLDANSATIFTDNQNGNAKSWVFDKQGNLTLPSVGGNILDSTGINILNGVISSSQQITNFGFVSSSVGTSNALPITGSTLNGIMTYKPNGSASVSYNLIMDDNATYLPTLRFTGSLLQSSSMYSNSLSKTIFNSSQYFIDDQTGPNGLDNPWISIQTKVPGPALQISGQYNSASMGMRLAIADTGNGGFGYQPLEIRAKTLQINVSTGSATPGSYGYPTGIVGITGSLNVSSSLTASLAEGYTWVGGINNISKLVATSSFGSGVASDTTLLNQFTGSVNTYTSSNDSVVQRLMQTTASLNTLTGSVSGIVNGLMAYTSSVIPRILQTTASLNTFTGSARIELNSIEAYTASLKAAGIVSSSTQIQNYYVFAQTSSANTFYGNQTITGSLFVTSTTVSDSTLLASGSNLILNSGSNLYINNNGLASITDRLQVSGSTILSGSTQITGSLLVTGSMTISSGSITMPNRPGVRVTGAGGGKTAVTTLSGSYLNVDWQQSNAWDNSTGTFTAPIAGLYQVNLTCRTNSNSLGTISQLIVYKNNTGGVTGTPQIMIEYGSNTTMNHTGGSTICKLAVGDTLKMVVAVGEISFDSNNNFSVAYIG